MSFIMEQAGGKARGVRPGLGRLGGRSEDGSLKKMEPQFEYSMIWI